MQETMSTVLFPVELFPSKMSQSEIQEILAYARQASQELGYTALEQEVLKAGSRNTLAVTLRNMGIKIFDPEQVKKYKEERLLKAIDRYQNDLSIKNGWLSIPINQYTGQLPFFTITMFLLMKKEVPAIRFFVEELCDQNRIVAHLLYVTLDDTSYYLDI